MKKQNVRTLALMVVTFTYLLVGAAIFGFLENKHADRKAADIRYMEKVWKDRFNISEEDYNLLEVLVLRRVPHKAGKQWKFIGAFYYSTTVLTTIGYGHSTPNTVPGKIFTILYAMVGIPLCLVLFHSIGERLNELFSLIIKKTKKTLKLASVQATDTERILAVTILSTVTITAGAGVFSSFEQWSYFDSVYYCVITLTTIGFGDMVALQKNEALETQPKYVAFTLLFILFGMAIVAASLNLFVLNLVTMNTEDERRDEAEALQAAADAVRLEGDVITANGSILSFGDPDLPPPALGEAGGVSGLASSADMTSVCSCTCITCASCSGPLHLFSSSRRRAEPQRSSRLRRMQRKSLLQLGYSTGVQHVSTGPEPKGVISQGVTQEELYSLDSSNSSAPELISHLLHVSRNSV